MDEIINTELHIDGFNQDDKKVTITQGREKYSFWMKKKDGSDTKAYENWKRIQPKVGDWIEIQFKEEDAEWLKDGKTIYFKRRTILQLREASGGTSSPKTSPRASQSVTRDSGDWVPRAEYEKKIADMSDAFMDMIRKIANLTERVEALENTVDPLYKNIPVIK